MLNGSVLVLEDCEDLLQLSKVFIENLCDRNAITVKSLHDIEVIEERALDCDLALLDINLGANEPNGLDVYHWLRDHGFKKRIVFLTGHARNYPLVAEAERLGDARVLSKPLLPADLISVVRGDS